MLRVTWLGHSAIHLRIGERSVLFDPFLTGNPSYPEGALEKLGDIDLICLTHGHEDHLGDTVPIAKRTVINVNFPARAAEEVRGVRVVRQGFHDYARGTLVEGTDPRGRPYYWFGLDDIEHTLDHGTDLEAVNDGFISVTPLHLALTHYAALGSLAEAYEG